MADDVITTTEKIVKLKYNDDIYGIEAGGYAVVKLSVGSWEGSSAPFTQKCTKVIERQDTNQPSGDFSSITDTTVCVVDLYFKTSEAQSNIKSLYSEWDKVYAAESFNNENGAGVEFYASEKPSSDFTVIIKW